MDFVDSSRAGAGTGARAGKRSGRAGLPLYGVPFAIKDNIDLAEVITTAGCPAFANLPTKSATVVERLIAAGALPIGKTNLDQFATGLVGTRSPYGNCQSVFDARYISGGSSSGSAVAVAAGMVTFAWAPIRRVRAHPGGVQPSCRAQADARFVEHGGWCPRADRWIACRSSRTNCHDAQAAWRVAKGFDPSDPYSRCRPGDGAAPWARGSFASAFRRPPSSNFSVIRGRGSSIRQRYARLSDWAGRRSKSISRCSGRRGAALFGAVGGGTAGASSPFSNRMPMIFIRSCAASSAARGRIRAVDAFEAEYRLQAAAHVAREWSRMDVLLLPSAPTMYTHEEVQPIRCGCNTNLGYYTNFVNLLDQAAVALPAGFRSDGLPFGITLIGPAFTDDALLALRTVIIGRTPRLPGPRSTGTVPAGMRCVAVVGAHLSGQPLNRQLT